MFRPEPMQCYELLLARDHAQELLEAIGRLECLEFVDLNAKIVKSSLHSAPQARKCEDLLTKIEQVAFWLLDATLGKGPSHRVYQEQGSSRRDQAI